MSSKSDAAYERSDLALVTKGKHFKQAGTIEEQIEFLHYLNLELSSITNAKVKYCLEKQSISCPNPSTPSTPCVLFVLRQRSSRLLMKCVVFVHSFQSSVLQFSCCAPIAKIASIFTSRPSQSTPSVPSHSRPHALSSSPSSPHSPPQNSSRPPSSSTAH